MAFSTSVLSALPSPTPDPNTTPALEAPPGLSSNLHDPPTRQAATIVAIVLFMVTTTPAVIARMVTRTFVHRSVQWDDWSMVLALIGLYAFSGMVLETLKFGNATDEWNVSKAQAARFGELIHDMEIVARVSIFFVKLSILLLYIRYFCPPQMRRMGIYWSSIGVIIFNLLSCIALVLTVAFQCVGKNAHAGQTCINSYALLITASLINVLTDIVMLIIPIVAFWSLQMPRKRKWGLWVVFAVAGLAVASSVARLGYQIPHAKTRNQTALLSNVVLLALAEHAIGMIVGCMPTFPALYRYILRRRTESQSSGSPKPRWVAALSDSFRKRRPPMRKAPGDTDLLTTQSWEMNTSMGSRGGEPSAPIQRPKRIRMKRAKKPAAVSQTVAIEALPRV